MNSSAPPILFSSEAARMSNFCNKSGLVYIYSRYIGTACYLPGVVVHVVSGVGAPGDLRLQLGRGGHVVVPGVRPAHCPAHRPGVAAVLGGGGGGEGGAPHPVAVPEGGRQVAG